MGSEESFRLRWCPVDTSDLFGSVWFQHMRDFQRGWYLCLLLRAWENRSKPCHLPNDQDQLWMLAGAPSRKCWEENSGLVMGRFDVTGDGMWLVNRKLLQVYEEQMAGYFRRKSAGEKGGKAKASNARAMPEQCLAQTSVSVSVSSSPHLELKDLEPPKNSDELIEKILRLHPANWHWRNEPRELQLPHAQCAAVIRAMGEHGFDRVTEGTKIYADYVAKCRPGFTYGPEKFYGLDRHYLKRQEDWEKANEQPSKARQRIDATRQAIVEGLSGEHAGPGGGEVFEGTVERGSSRVGALAAGKKAGAN